MRAAVIASLGAPGVIELHDRPTPTPAHDEVLVRVMASALNRADLLQRAGRYAAPPGWPVDIPGLEFAGVVAACGASVKRWREGDRVFGLVGGGAHAEFLVAHERAVAKVPQSVSWLQAGALPEACITAHDAIVSQANFRAGESVLIHAAGSGVGLVAIQLVRALGGTAFATARGASKVEAALAAGASQAMVVTNVADVAPTVMQWTNGRGVDIVLDLVGGDYLAASVASLAMRGRVMCVGSLAGRATQLDLGVLMTRRASVTGTVLRTRPLEERIAATQRFEREVVPWLASGAITTAIDSAFSIDQINDAHARLETNNTVGKVVIRIGATE